MSEHALQNAIRNAMAGQCLLFRANVGKAWTGKTKRIDGQTVLIDQARPFDTGLPAGFSDLFGMVPVTITPDMVGQTIAQFVAIEVKTPSGRVSDKQQRFLAAVEAQGGRGVVARSVEDAQQVIQENKQ